jgi:hypothetical protein
VGNLIILEGERIGSSNVKMEKTSERKRQGPSKGI